MWNTNKCKAKAFKYIQLRPCKYILRCSVTTCDEPVCAYLGLKTLRSMKNFRTLRWYCKVSSMNDEGLPLKLLIDEWNKVKCKGFL